MGRRVTESGITLHEPLVSCFEPTQGFHFGSHLQFSHRAARALCVLFMELKRSRLLAHE
jgi:hypothetical protein